MAFTEDWYSDQQICGLSVLAQTCRALEGTVLEFGCWEGKSTCALAIATFPDVVIAVDTWQGNLDETLDHDTVRILQERDVLATFRSNVSSLTRGNVQEIVSDCHEFMDSFSEPIKLCHIDACHDYQSVKRSIIAVEPLVVPGGILCGDDYVWAHSSREDLDGGVERAVSECLPGHKTMGNLWYWVRPAFETPD